MIVGLITELGPWSWLIAGLVLLGIEILMPGFVFIWFGLAALLIGGLALLVDIGWQLQALLFAALSLVLVIVGRRFFKVSGGQPDRVLNQRASAMVGQTFVLIEPIVNGFGRIRIDDTPWRVSGPELAEGTRVMVQRADGAVLHVLPVDGN